MASGAKSPRLDASVTGRFRPIGDTSGKMSRAPITHVVIIDGTLASLEPERQSNASIAYNLIREIRPAARYSIRYEEGIQFLTWGNLIDIAAGRGITRQVRRAYGFIASRWRPGDRIFLFGFSRGAYAVRSLAGVIDQIGLLKPAHATERNINQVFRYYRDEKLSAGAQSFGAQYCWPGVSIDMIGVWDTVKAIGISWPVLWRLAPDPQDFHNHDLGATTKAGFHALALDESRRAFTPIMWAGRPEWVGRMEQVWFRGSHGDVGGFLGGFEAARPLANLPLVWMMDRAEECGLDLPEGWRDRFPCNPDAPAHGTYRGIAKFYLMRKRRIPLRDPSESIHESALFHAQKLGYTRARGEK
jgi:uncharacterized protein (DUF2235 family)